MQVKLCDPYLSVLSVRYYNKRRYTRVVPKISYNTIAFC